jgi:hypothetical protein
MNQPATPPVDEEAFVGVSFDAMRVHLAAPPWRWNSSGEIGCAGRAT